MFRSMCASYMIKQRNPKGIGLEHQLRIDDFEQFDNKLIVPYTFAPVLKLDGVSDVIEMVSMKFSMVPSWSKEPKVKFATHNARLDTITEKPTWRTVFKTRHCVIPMTNFIEPIYDGDLAGNMVSFGHGDFMLAAGVWDEWVNKETGEVSQSFAIITDDPPEFVAEIGHDRCPVFLGPSAAKEWAKNEGQPSNKLKQFLLSGKTEPNLTTEVFRPMKPGWEKRK